MSGAMKGDKSMLKKNKEIRKKLCQMMREDTMTLFNRMRRLRNKNRMKYPRQSQLRET